MDPRPLTDLPQEQLDWIARFTDRLRLDEPALAKEDCGVVLIHVARDAWERPEWRGLGPEAAARRWLVKRSFG